MKTREEALNYGLSFPNTYMEMPFHDPNWQLVRAFLLFGELIYLLTSAIWICI